tara:strand:- start:483 stop:665 length:183 start_codon:yes stop_codon:yes gene_type:complete
MYFLTMWESYDCSSKSFQTAEEAQAFYDFKVQQKDKDRCHVIYIHDTKKDTKKILKNSKS